jgi:DNA replication protein DnaC
LLSTGTTVDRTVRCIECAQPSGSPRCADCTDVLFDAAMRDRAAEGPEAMGYVGVPENLRGARTDRFDWLGDGRGLALHGPPGVGKSWLAAGLVRRQLWAQAKTTPVENREWWWGVRFIRSDALMQAIRTGFEGSEGEAEMVRIWGETPYLVIDDLGAEKRSEWVGQTLHSLLSLREAAPRTTVVTTNYTLDDLREMYAGWGPPIASRLDGLCLWTEMTGKDRRR